MYCRNKLPGNQGILRDNVLIKITQTDCFYGVIVDIK